MRHAKFAKHDRALYIFVSTVKFLTIRMLVYGIFCINYTKRAQPAAFMLLRERRVKLNSFAGFAIFIDILSDVF